MDRVGALLTAMTRARIILWLLACACGATIAVAQTEPPKPAVKAPKKQQTPPPQPQAQPQPAPQAAAPQMPPTIYSPWTKICPKQPPGAPQGMKQVCLTMKEARLENGQFLAGAAVIEQQGEEKKLLRITLPLGMQIPPGSRVTLDGEQPVTAIYVTCIPNGCMSDFEINPAFIDRMKKGQQLLLQGVNMQGQVANYTLPLVEFGKAVDGTPTDQEEFDRKQRAEWEQRLKKQQAAPPK